MRFRLPAFPRARRALRALRAAVIPILLLGAALAVAVYSSARSHAVSLVERARIRLLAVPGQVRAALAKDADGRRLTGALTALWARRRTLALGAAFASIMVVGIHEVPAIVGGDPAHAAEQERSAAQAAVVEFANAQAQTLEVDATATDSEATVARDAYAMTYFSIVKWPIAGGSPISSYFGPRKSPCRGCSSYHHGVDFVPGYGTPIQAIADGVVVEANNGGELGTHIVIQHNIDGEIVNSGYAHMIRGSMAVGVGQTVKAGQVIGAVGSTGESTGAHLHFFMEHGSSVFDPLPWLNSHVNA